MASLVSSWLDHDIAKNKHLFTSLALFASQVQDPAYLEDQEGKYFLRSGPKKG